MVAVNITECFEFGRAERTLFFLSDETPRKKNMSFQAVGRTKAKL